MILQANKGLSEVRNRVVLKASDEYFFMDSDDEFFPDSIYNLVQIAKKYNNMDIVHGRFISIPDKWFNMWPMEKLELPEYINDKKLLSNILRSGKVFPIMKCGKLLSIRLFKEKNFFFKARIMQEDDHINFLLAKHISSIAYTNCYVYHRNDHGINLNKDSHKRHLQSLKIIYNDWVDNLSAEFKDEEKSFILEHSYQTYESENFNDFNFMKLLFPLFKLKLSSIIQETFNEMYKKKYITKKYSV